ncbi:MAG TPA: class I SAM-dependent methyltransferase [Dehalococcoidia bacterium]|jgi:2-polyprenyl-3-methyl-5-hydroxy-6-metoxy-1,4-benzoquinol methylase|nr:class I SAM-dependent methyltransferase [Dehalococcoidia bacterium]
MAQQTAVAPEEQLRVESELARRLLDAGDAERQQLYGEVYDRIMAMHLTRLGPTAVEQTCGASPGLLGLLTRLTRPGEAVLEIGCGTGYLAIECARRGRRVTAVDVSGVNIETARRHAAALGARAPRFERVSGVQLPFADASFNFAYSVEVLEHLHARDVPLHLREVFRVLRPGGRYWILTPNGLDDCSAADRFGVHLHAGESVADVHLKEWTYGELAIALRRAGFRALRTPWRQQRGHVLPFLPVGAKVAAERLAAWFRNPRLRRLVSVASGTVACSIVAQKP